MTHDAMTPIEANGMSPDERIRGALERMRRFPEAHRDALKLFLKVAKTDADRAALSNFTEVWIAASVMSEEPEGGPRGFGLLALLVRIERLERMAVCVCRGRALISCLACEIDARDREGASKKVEAEPKEEAEGCSLCMMDAEFGLGEVVTYTHRSDCPRRPK
jgi:hypothetical protein